MWIGIVALVWCLGQGVYTALSMWSYRVDLELYFDAIWNRRSADRADRITMSSFRQWRKAQGWRFWWAVLQKTQDVIPAQGEETMKMKNLLAASCLGMLATQLATACTPPSQYTVYFGEAESLPDRDVEARIQADMKKHRVTIIEYRVGTIQHVVVQKDDIVYVLGKPVATKRDSFWYLGFGYYQLNRELYYMGEHIGAYPMEGTVIVHSEDTSPTKPDNVPLSNWCGATRHVDMLDTSTGLHVEHEIYDN